MTPRSVIRLDLDLFFVAVELCSDAKVISGDMALADRRFRISFQSYQHTDVSQLPYRF